MTNSENEQENMNGLEISEVPVRLKKEGLGTSEFAMFNTGGI